MLLNSDFFFIFFLTCRECSTLIVGFHQRARLGKLTGVYRKYCSSKFGFAAKCYDPAYFLLENELWAAGPCIATGYTFINVVGIFKMNIRATWVAVGTGVVYFWVRHLSLCQVTLPSHLFLVISLSQGGIYLEHLSVFGSHWTKYYGNYDTFWTIWFLVFVYFSWFHILFILWYLQVEIFCDVVIMSLNWFDATQTKPRLHFIIWNYFSLKPHHSCLVKKSLSSKCTIGIWCYTLKLCYL